MLIHVVSTANCPASAPENRMIGEMGGRRREPATGTFAARAKITTVGNEWITHARSETDSFVVVRGVGRAWVIGFSRVHVIDGTGRVRRDESDD